MENHETSNGKAADGERDPPDIALSTTAGII
jgi:hypothetical protein